MAETESLAATTAAANGPNVGAPLLQVATQSAEIQTELHQKETRPPRSQSQEVDAYLQELVDMLEGTPPVANYPAA